MTFLIVFVLKRERESVLDLTRMSHSPNIGGKESFRRSSCERRLAPRLRPGGDGGGGGRGRGRGGGGREGKSKKTISTEWVLKNEGDRGDNLTQERKVSKCLWTKGIGGDNLTPERKEGKCLWAEGIGGDNLTGEQKRVSVYGRR